MGYNNDLLSSMRTSDLVVPKLPAPRNPAKEAYASIVSEVRSFEGELDTEHEAGAFLAAHASGATLRIEQISRRPGSDFITLWGTRDSDGARIRLVQHYTQVSILLVALDKVGDKPRRIGFGVEDQEEAEQTGPLSEK